MDVEHRHEQFNKGSNEEDLVFEYKGENPKDGSLENQTRLKWEFRNDTWQKRNFICDPLLRPFSRCGRGPTFIY